jgi:hypothetical protein
VSDYLNGISEEFKKSIGTVLNTNSNMSEIEEDYELTYNNGAAIFEWNFKYSNVESCLNGFPYIKCFTAKSGSWKFPLIIDYNNGIVFTLMKESNVDAKRKITNKPLHYEKKLSKINKHIYLQQTLMLENNQESNYEILSSLCSDINIEDVPENLIHCLITFDTNHGEIKSIKANVFDELLHLIEPATNWNSHIEINYPKSNSSSKIAKQQIQENNEKIKQFAKKTEQLVSMKTQETQETQDN